MFQPPHGNFERLIVPNPAIGANWEYSVPTGCLFQIHHITFQLSTDATVSNRQPFMALNYAGSRMSAFANTQVQAASQARVWIFTLGLPTSAQAIGTVLICGLPTIIMLRPDWVFASAIYNLQAGDQLTAISITGERWVLP
ncbi:MAG: hypothetical protein A2Y63_00275 [Candidatus Riflebacteria bacterium RBG_13_59_9]|nr:MAG: hypothetical protein A2Y63_00275 [Candidatus Riflebacteria bacterium RBG_13_59_9]